MFFERAQDGLALSTASSTRLELLLRDARERGAGVVVEALTTDEILGVGREAVNFVRRQPGEVVARCAVIELPRRVVPSAQEPGELAHARCPDAGLTSTNRALRRLSRALCEAVLADHAFEVAERALDEGVVLRRMRHVVQRDDLALLQEGPHALAAKGTAVVERHHQGPASALRACTFPQPNHVLLRRRRTDRHRQRLGHERLAHHAAAHLALLVALEKALLARPQHVAGEHLGVHALALDAPALAVSALLLELRHQPL